MNGEFLILTNGLIMASKEKDGMKNYSRILALTSELVLFPFAEMAEIGNSTCCR